VKRSTEQMRLDALKIWRAGLDAVRSDKLVADAIQVDRNYLIVGGKHFNLEAIRKIVVVGAGKAGAGMATSVENVLGTRLMEEKKLVGWVNVPENCVRKLKRIRLFGTRPAIVNEPTQRGVIGSNKILKLVEKLTPNDLCLCLLSGGGSALMPAPAEGITLEDKQQVTRFLSAAGANIEQLNTVRKQLSRIKGGGLARARTAGTLISLIISDVLGDPLDVIASGPTTSDKTTPESALDILEIFDAQSAGISKDVFRFLRKKCVESTQKRYFYHRSEPMPLNLVIGNNATAVEAAGTVARQLGYSCETQCASGPEGMAEDVGTRLADLALKLRDNSGPDCIVSGGEPVVKLVAPDKRGLGGRNQQLTLAALKRLQNNATGIAILSAGTDGEDGPTNAAGAICNERVINAATARGMSPEDYLARNDAYHFFEPLEALIKTGPTNTNVCDVRVVVVNRIQSPRS